MGRSFQFLILRFTKAVIIYSLRNSRSSFMPQKDRGYCILSEALMLQRLAALDQKQRIEKEIEDLKSRCPHKNTKTRIFGNAPQMVRYVRKMCLDCNGELMFQFLKPNP